MTHSAYMRHWLVKGESGQYWLMTIFWVNHSIFQDWLFYWSERIHSFLFCNLALAVNSEYLYCEQCASGVRVLSTFEVPLIF